jgi:AraC-like DNA-binding protein
MSQASFCCHFSRITGMSPLQFQKRFWLYEAQRLMLTEITRAEAAAYNVDYDSSTRFGREYKRQFGELPRQNIQRLITADAVGALKGTGKRRLRLIAKRVKEWESYFSILNISILTCERLSSFKTGKKLIFMTLSVISKTLLLPEAASKLHVSEQDHHTGLFSKICSHSFFDTTVSLPPTFSASCLPIPV